MRVSFDPVTEGRVSSSIVVSRIVRLWPNSWRNADPLERKKMFLKMTVMLMPLWMYAIHERDTAWTIENWISSGRIRIERSRLYEREEKNFSPPFATLETKISRANVGWFIRVKGGESRIRIQRIKIISIRFFFHENFSFPRNFVSDVSERWTQRVGSTEEEAWI